MDRDEIDVLVDRYTIALEHEHNAIVEAAKVDTANEQLRVAIVGAAYAAGTIDGKNADTRKAQESALMAENKDYQAAVKVATDAQTQVAITGIIRKGIEAEIGLVKAWLYSQSGR
jgi:hypothetical protein